MKGRNGLNPFPGLRAFEPEEDYLFFGREKETDELRRRLRTSRFLAVVGGSGSGKSSLMKSGLIPSLHAGFMAGAGSGWRVATLRPGEDPFGNLVRALHGSGVAPSMEGTAATKEKVLSVTLRDSSLGVAEAVKHARLPGGENVLVVVDQFEELFRFRRGQAAAGADDEAVAFVRLLLDAARQDYAPVFVALTMRSEFIGDCMPFPGLPEAINDGQYLIPRMTRDEMRAAITRPVAVGGATMAPRLVVRLLNEVGDETDHLPVLQHALMRTWDAWARDHAEGEPLDVRHYESTGTMKAALSLHAEEAYEGLPSERARALAERLFKTITETTEEGRGVRRPTPLGRLAAVCGTSEGEVAEVVEAFRQPGRAFLQPPVGTALEANSIIDISHESLMRLWERLTLWTKEERRSADIYERLSRSAERHAAGEESLWRNPQLQIGLRWRRENRPTAAWAGDERGFERSMRFLERSRRAHLLRRAALVALVLAVIAGLVWWGYQQRLKSLQLAEEARVLNEKLERLQKEQAAEAALVETGTREVEELRERNAQLKAGVASAQKRREELNASIKALREGNLGVEQRIAVLNTENKGLENRINELGGEWEALSAEGGRLRDEAADLQRQKRALGIEEERMTQAEAEARARLSELVRKAKWLGYVVTPEILPRTFDEFPPLDIPDALAGIFNVPRDVADNDALRRQLEELQRLLEELRAARARQVDEAGWLKKENELLERQLAVLLKEVQNLTRAASQLAARARELRRLAAAAARERQRLSRDAAEVEAGAAAQRAVVEKLRVEVEAARKENSELVHQIESLRVRIDRLHKDIRSVAEFISERLENGLTNPGPQVPADVAGLEAVAAFHVAPFDPDETAYPSVYNALWLALERLDQRAALEAIRPAGGKGKIGTTTSVALAREICARVRRGFTEQEWAVYFPQRPDYEPPDYNSPLGAPCRSLPPGTP